MKKLLYKLKLIWRIILNKSGVRKTDSTSYFVWYMKNVTTESIMTNCTIEINKDGLLSIENMLMYNVHFIISHPNIKFSMNDSRIVTNDDGVKNFIEINNAPENINFPFLDGVDYVGVDYDQYRHHKISHQGIAQEQSK